MLSRWEISSLVSPKGSAILESLRYPWGFPFCPFF